MRPSRSWLVRPTAGWASSIAISIRSPRPGALDRYLSERWRRHLAQYGKFNCGPYAERGTYPRFQPFLSRRDAFPPNGGAPGSDVGFIREQLLDRYNIAYGVLEPLLGGNTSRNLDEAAALCSAMNDWQAYEFTDPEPRLRASILVPQDDPAAAVKEIEKRAGDWRFAQIQLGSKTSEPVGRRRYWPIFAAAQAHGLSIGLHVGGTFTQRAVSRRLAAILYRGASRPGAFDAEPGGEPDPGRCVRCLSRIEGGDDRGRLCLGAATGVAAGCALGEDARGGAAEAQSHRTT